MESSAVLDRLETSDEIRHLTILDLPLELLIEIISYKCILLKDRINLRSTCSVMERAVGLCDYNNNAGIRGDLAIHQSNTCHKHGVSEWKTILSREDVLNERGKEFSASRFSSYAHLMSRLFRRSFFMRIRISFNIKNKTTDLFFKSLLEFSQSLACEYLFITVSNNEEYDDRLFQIIDNIQIREGLVLDLGTATVEKKYLLNLPTLKYLKISSDHGRRYKDPRYSSKSSETLTVDDSVFRALLSKTRRLDLCVEVSISRESWIQAQKIVKEDDVRVSFNVNREFVEKKHPSLVENAPKDISCFYYNLKKNSWNFGSCS